MFLPSAYLLPQKSTICFAPRSIFKGVLAVLDLVIKHLLSACQVVDVKKIEMGKINQEAEMQQSAIGTGCDESVQGSLVRDQEKIQRYELNLGGNSQECTRQRERGMLGNGRSKWEEMGIYSSMFLGCTLVSLEEVRHYWKWGQRNNWGHIMKVGVQHIRRADYSGSWWAWWIKAVVQNVSWVLDFFKTLKKGMGPFTRLSSYT